MALEAFGRNILESQRGMCLGDVPVFPRIQVALIFVINFEHPSSESYASPKDGEDVFKHVET